jgi:purine-binding chemotaxis protein CheW
MSAKVPLLNKVEEEQLVQLIVFRASDEEFSVPIDVVQEIIKVGHITPIPDAPDFMRGLINVRGDIVSIMDIKKRFSLKQGGDSKHIIITTQAGGLFGLMVDEVLEVLRVKKTDINTTPSLITKIQKKYVQGVVVYENRLIILLDLSSILSQKELVKIAESNSDYHKSAIQHKKPISEYKKRKKKNLN